VFSRKKRQERQEILEHTTHNREEVLASKVCGCVNCLKVFPPDEVTAWNEELMEEIEPTSHGHRGIRRDPTALCPHCGEAMVLGDRSGHRIAPASLDALRSRMRIG